MTKASASAAEAPCRVEIRRSSIEGAGLGVFTTVAVRRDDKLTRYNGIVVRHDITSGEYSQRLPTREILVGDPLHFCVSMCAHMINDALTVVSTGTPEDVQRSALTYVRDSPLAANVHMRFEPRTKQLYAVASRDINAGDELFCSYGINYWISRPLQLAVNERRLHDAIVLEDILLRLLPVERGSQSEPVDGWPPLTRKLPPHIFMNEETGELAVSSRDGDRPTDDECRRALMWAMIDPSVSNPYTLLKSAMASDNSRP